MSVYEPIGSYSGGGGALAMREFRICSSLGYFRDDYLGRGLSQEGEALPYEPEKPVDGCEFQPKNLRMGHDNFNTCSWLSFQKLYLGIGGLLVH